MFTWTHMTDMFELTPKSDLSGPTKANSLYVCLHRVYIFTDVVCSILNTPKVLYNQYVVFAARLRSELQVLSYCPDRYPPIFQTIDVAPMPLGLEAPMTEIPGGKSSHPPCATKALS